MRRGGGKLSRRPRNALRHGATARPDPGEVAREASRLLGDLPGSVSGDSEVWLAAERLAAAGLQLAAANDFATRAFQVDPRSTFAREVHMVEDVLEDLLRAMPVRLEAVEMRADLLAQSLHLEAADRHRAHRYRGEALGRYHRAVTGFLKAVRAEGG